MNATVLGIVVGVLLVFMTASEVNSWRRAFRNYKVALHNKQGTHPYPMFEVARPISFLISVLSYADAALLTLFAQDMLAGGEFADNTFLLAIPLTVVYLAYLISGPVRMFVVRHLGLRGAFLVGCAGITAGFLATAASIALGNFALFVGMVFAYRVFLYLLISCGRLMPTLAPTEHQRTDINIETDNADVSASALMGVVVGYAAQYLGNLSVYFVALVPVVVLVVFVCKFVPKGRAGETDFGGESARNEDVHSNSRNNLQTPPKNSLSKEYKKPSSKEYESLPVKKYENSPSNKHKKTPLRHFIFHPAMISLFFFALITLGFSACYRSYLFPLFATSGGLNKSDISNLTVICSVIVFYAAPPLTRLAHRLGSRNLLVCVLVVCAITFFGFVVPSLLSGAGVSAQATEIASFTWSVVALLLVILIKKVGEPCTRTLWPRVADSQGVSRHSAQAAYEVMDGIICFAKMPVTGALLTLGHVVVCGIFAAYSAASAILFSLTTNRGPFAGREMRALKDDGDGGKKG